MCEIINRQIPWHLLMKDDDGGRAAPKPNAFCTLEGIMNVWERAVLWNMILWTGLSKFPVCRSLWERHFEDAHFLLQVGGCGFGRFVFGGSTDPPRG